MINLKFSRFFNKKYSNIDPYDTTGEHINLERFIKLNTNESPFPPSPLAVKYAADAAEGLNLYSDPDCTELTLKLAEALKVSPEKGDAAARQRGIKLEKENILFGNGSDEILNFAFMAFCDTDNGVAFPDITYSFYKVLACTHNLPFETVKLHDDFKIHAEDYFNLNKTIFIANPNAPTGLALSTGDIEKILMSNPDNVVVIDEAYVDFGGTSCIDLIQKYKNLLVVQTFSKSRSLAGGRLGFAVGDADLINDLKAIKNSFSPYNINSMTMAAAVGAIEDTEYFNKNCNLIMKNREFTSCELKKLGFELTDSITNFIFARHDNIDGLKLFNELRKRNILVRHFNSDKLAQYNRITIGTLDQMKILINTIKEIIL